MTKVCAVSGCLQPHDSIGYCAKHAARVRRHGDPTREPASQSERFWSRVERSGDCWLWLGGKTNGGYGKFGKYSLLTHRFAFEDLRAEIPPGLQIDHLCMNKLCVNPWHMDVVTPAENSRRRDIALGTGSARTHCPKGHPYDEENTAHRNGRRHCRACDRAWSARTRQRKKAMSL